MRPGRLYPIAVGGGFGLCPGAVAADRYGNVLIGDQARNRGAWAQAGSGAVRPSFSAAACPLVRDAP